MFDEWHNGKCLFMDCSRYGVQILPLCPKEVIGSNVHLISQGGALLLRRQWQGLVGH